MRYETDRSRVTGLGASHTGTHHFWEQRLSAIALLILAPFFVITLSNHLGEGYDAVRAAYGRPINAIIAVAFILTAFLHLFQGLQVVIEDYVHGRLGMITIIATRLLCAFFALAGVFAVLKIAFAS